MNRIKELRKEKGLTQQDLAEEIYVHYRTIQRWENKHKIALDQAQLLADKKENNHEKLESDRKIPTI